MNVENIKIVRDHIAGLPPEQFNMHTSGDDCGSPCCIGGWANRLTYDADDWHPLISSFGEPDAMTALGLDDATAHALFYPGVTTRIGGNPYGVRPAQAVRVLNHLLASGEVDWSIIDTPVEA
jgi:hypothetical protein